MENNNQRTTVPFGTNGATPRPNPVPTPLFADVSRVPLTAAQPQTPPLAAPIAAIPSTPSLSPLPAASPPAPTIQPTPLSSRATPPTPTQHNWKKTFIQSGITLLILLLIGAGILLFNNLRERPGQQQTSSSINNTSIPLSEFADSGSLSLLGGQSLIVNGQLRANETFVLAPQTQPATGERGQIYYDTNNNQLAYFNGERFINLPGSDFVQSFQGQSGNVSLAAGDGITILGTTISNDGVTSIGGQSGDISLGTGLTISGSTLQTTGVQSLASGSPTLTIADDGSGNLTITSSGAGTGNVTTSGGTVGALPLFTTGTNIQDSIITQSGGTITVGGDLTVTGALTLGTPLTVANGGTGAGSFAADGIIIGNGSASLSSVTAGGPGLCLISTAGAPAFSACPGGGGVVSLNGLSGALTLANASGAGTTITINDASTAQKGIAQFDATNFSASGGLINTIQNINVSASPTFANMTLTGDLALNGGDLTSSGALNITPGGTLIVGATSQTLTLQGGASTTLSATSGANTTTLSFQTPGANVNYRLPTAAAGNYDLCSTAGNCAGVGGGVTTSGGTINRLAKFTAAQGIGDSTITDDGTNVSTTVDLVVQGGNITVGVASSQTGNLSFAHSGSGFLGTIVQGTLSDNRTYTLPNMSGEICLNSGNCNGSGTNNTLQAAYDAGNIITTTDGRDLDVVLANTTVDSNFDITIADGSTGTVAISRADGGGTADPSQMLLIDNLDTTRSVAAGIKLQAAAGGLVTAIDASDAEIGDALNAGANNIVGTVGNLDFTNFDVVGNTGNITTAGDLALNGGDLTSIGALNVTPGGAMTLGATTQTATLRGSVTTITSNGAGNDIVLNSADTIELQDTTNVTGNLTVTGAAPSALVVKASTNGTGDLVMDLQQNDSDSIMRLTDTGTLAVGNGTNIAGILSLAKGSGGIFGEIRTTNLLSTTVFHLPEVGGGVRNICTDAGNCGTATGTLQNAYSYSAGGSTPEIKLDATRNGIEIQDANTTIGSGQNFLSLRGSNAAGLGSILVGFGIQGNLFMQPSANRTDLVDINTNGGANLLTVDSVNSRVGIGLGGSNLPAFTLDVGGTINTTGAATFGSTVAVGALGATNTATYLCRNASNQIAACSTTGAGAAFIQGGNSFGATGVLGTNDANALEFETSNTTRISIGATGGVTVNAGNALTVTSGATTLTGATSGDALTVSNSTSTGNIAVFKDNATNVATIADGGATTFQNSVNSANAFRILNSSGTNNELVGVDSTDSILRLLSNNTGHLSGTGTNWNTGTALPAPRKAGVAVTVNGYLYHIGGCDAATPDGDATTTVYYARANSDGTIGPWTATTSLPQTMCGGAGTTYNGYIYVNGASGGSANSRDVYYAKPNSDGTISAWTTQNDPTGYTIGLKDNGVAAHNGYLYITGGFTDDGLDTNNRTVYYGRINADGSVPSFTAQTLWLPANDFNPGNTTVANGYLYVFGTANYDKFYYGRINANGSVATAAEATGTTGARKYGSIAVMNGYMYAIAGATTPVNTISYGALANNGDIAAFTTDTTTLPAARWLCSKNAPVVNNYIYLIGCGDSTDFAQTSVYYAGGTRVKVGGGLDLVGYSGEGMSEGGSGGQLTAGNTFVNGSLSVTGNTNLKDGAVVGNNLAVNGLTSLQTTTNSTTGFQVLNASAVPQFAVDTTNARVYIGNPTADSTGALLVLDTKNTTGDPTGVDGGMYYNSFLGTFRCYENGAWTECTGTPKPNTARTTMFMANRSSATLDGYGDTLTIQTGAGSSNGGTLGSNSAPQSYHSTGSTSGTQVGVSSSDNYLLEPTARYTYQTLFDFQYLGDGTSARVWTGFTDQTFATMAGAAAPAGTYAAFRYDTSAGDTTIKCVTNDNATATVADSGLAPASVQNKLEITLITGTRAIFKINGQTVCNMTATVPSSAALRIVSSVTNLTAASRAIGIGWIYIQGDPL